MGRLFRYRSSISEALIRPREVISALLMVVREKSLTERRQTNIVITDRGRQTLKDAPEPLQQRNVQRFKQMEDWEQAMLVAALERVATMLDAEDLQAGAFLITGDLNKAE